ncbi:MAG: 4-alpha-glucanotransferase [Bacteroidetes bacterium GWB2_41_8]|nr:MAG: 4-alpha-glucanotransferase [Bacteroidetes bacterium GWB2_41_8]
MKRSSGILLHISSLPGSDGIGSLGKEAFLFVDLLTKTKQKLWQILPLCPTGYGNSPYQCYSAFAGDPLFIDIQQLVAERLISKDSVTDQHFKAKKVEFERVEEWKMTLFHEAFSSFKKNFDRYKDEYVMFMSHNSWWLDDYALFRSLKTKYGETVWNTWKKKLVTRDKLALQEAFKDLHVEIDFHRFLQFIFFRQWFKLKTYANSKGISIIGDIPLYVSLDSADVWANQDIFLLDEDSKPTQVGGVPPDYFSETGQLWGNPVFDWERVAERDFDWWLARIHFNLRMFDQIRVDHFRGLESFWAVAAEAKTAVVGEWLPAKGYELFRKLKEQLGSMNIIAEDLGVITTEVEKLRDNFGLPGMKILQFAFGSDAENENLPHNYDSNFVVYTGTHDNDTTLGWFNSIEKSERKVLRKYLKGNGKELVRQMTEYAWASSARMALIPMQDMLGLDSEARMNTPGTATGNWTWRFTWPQVRANHQHFLREITKRYNR